MAGAGSSSKHYSYLVSLLLLIMAAEVSALDNTRADAEMKKWVLEFTLGGLGSGFAHLELHLSIGVVANRSSESNSFQGGAADENKEVDPNQGIAATEGEFVTWRQLVGLWKIVMRRGNVGITAFFNEKAIIFSGRIVWRGFYGSISCPFEFVI